MCMFRVYVCAHETLYHECESVNVIVTSSIVLAAAAALVHSITLATQTDLRDCMLNVRPCTNVASK